mmetsp:Transcript_20330/g.81247  ORF Transcript_20330/g.81247 Transcript_20330/m.81247 type:complete len:299 (+) Transcript_20330:1901-2797(+)
MSCVCAPPACGPRLLWCPRLLRRGPPPCRSASPQDPLVLYCRVSVHSVLSAASRHPPALRFIGRPHGGHRSPTVSARAKKGCPLPCSTPIVLVSSESPPTTPSPRRNAHRDASRAHLLGEVVGDHLGLLGHEGDVLPREGVVVPEAQVGVVLPGVVEAHVEDDGAGLVERVERVVQLFARPRRLGPRAEAADGIRERRRDLDAPRPADAHRVEALLEPADRAAVAVVHEVRRLLVDLLERRARRRAHVLRVRHDEHVAPARLAALADRRIHVAQPVLEHRACPGRRRRRGPRGRLVFR